VHRIKNANILIIAEHGITCGLIFQLFQEKGAKPQHTSTETDALRLFKRTRFDLVILDNMLPLDPSGMISKIKGMKNDIPVLLINADDGEKGSADLHSPRADVRVTRPLKIDTLLPLASQIISHKKKRNKP
jgi:DNA-binding response OmpR family regulator